MTPPLLHPLPWDGALPARLPDPLDRAVVPPVARYAAERLQAMLAAPEAAVWQLDAPLGGKMFGVLVVRTPDGTLAALHAFAGMLGGRWMVPGWAPPVFDVPAFEAIWPGGDAELAALAAARAALGQGPSAQRRAIDAARTARSNALLSALQALYRFRSARGEDRTLHALFAPALPPGGAGDCAGPKLLVAAQALGCTPLAMAEFWWGAPPRSGDRRSGAYYGACRGKCAPILAHLLDGLDVAWSAPPGAEGTATLPLPICYEDEALVIVNKPVGLLSVPGRSAQLRDSVATRLAVDAQAPHLVHRLDLDTSGLVIAARQHDVFVALQRQFAVRAVEKTYEALVEGDVREPSGSIALPLRVDVDDRPRQIHDPIHGKAAHTDWRRVGVEARGTRVVLVPHTGRTHQLRVHAAHPLGLDAPIVGDRLYGRTVPEHGARLCLHAHRLRFVHPRSGRPVEVTAPVPF